MVKEVLPLLSLTPPARRRAKAKPLVIGETFAAPRPPRPKGIRGSDKQRRVRNMEQTAEFIASGKWDSARAGHFVALYATCHEKVYGFAPNELEAGKEYSLACLAASRMLTKQFKGSTEVMVEFMRWVWTREQGREKWRRQNSTGGQRIGWRLNFNGSLISDYRVDVARRKAQP